MRFKDLAEEFLIGLKEEFGLGPKYKVAHSTYNIYDGAHSGVVIWVFIAQDDGGYMLSFGLFNERGKVWFRILHNRFFIVRERVVGDIHDPELFNNARREFLFYLDLTRLSPDDFLKAGRKLNWVL